MDPQVQASFIPKKPVDMGAARGGGAFGGLLFLIAIILFISSLVAAGAAFGYQSYLTKSISDQSTSLQKAEAAFDPGAIQELVRIDSRINQASVLLQKHVAPSAIFSFLADQTLQTVQFTSFTYELQADGSAKLSLGGLADSFASVALQSDQFGANKLLKNVVFSGVQAGTGGKVAFSVAAVLDASVIHYANNLAATGSVSNIAPPTTTSAPAAPSATTTSQAPVSPFQ